MKKICLIVAGGLFVLPMLLFTWLLNHVPSPSGKDVQAPFLQKEDLKLNIGNITLSLILFYIIITFLKPFL